MKHAIHSLTLTISAVLMVSCGSIRSPLALRVRTREKPVADQVCTLPVTTTPVPMPERWWEVFGSEELDGLMKRAFEGNLALGTAWARLRQTRAMVISAGAAGRPQVTATGESSTSIKRTENGGTADTDASNSFYAGLGLSFELDLWGRIYAATTSAEEDLLVSEADVRSTALALSGQIASAWLQLRAAQAELATIREQITTSRTSLELLESRQRKGMSERVDVLQQQQQVAALESVVPGLQETIAVQRLEIAYLLGLSGAGDLQLSEGGLPDLPPLPAPGLPAEILVRRPDVQAAWHQLMAQEWTVVSARADRLPTLSLTGTAALSSADVDRIFDNWLASLAGSLVAPILDGGKRRATVTANRALADVYFLAYRDSVLTALREVCEGLERERWRGETVARVQSEASYSAQTLEETQRRYRSGLSDYLPVLTALSSKQSADRSVISARSTLLLNRVALYQALGGAWMNDLPEPKQTSAAETDR